MLWVSLLFCSSVLSFYVPDIPYHRQVTEYACGDGSSEMVLNYYGSDIDQRAIINVLRTSPDVGTLSDDIVRGARFSQFSSATTTRPFPFPQEVPQSGWNKKRYYGYGGFLYRNNQCWSDELKDILAGGNPVILLMHYSDPSQQDGHFRVAFGYDETQDIFMLLDPWDRNNSDDSLPARYRKPHPIQREHWPAGNRIRSRPDPMQDVFDDTQPRVVTYSTDEMCALWNYSEFNGNATNLPYYGAFVSPWQVSLGYSENVDRSMTITANVTYPCPTPFCPTSDSTATALNSTILLSLPPQMKLRDKRDSFLIALGDMAPQETKVVTWVVNVADSLSKEDERSLISVHAYGLIKSSVPDMWLDATTLYAAGYPYQDIIGGTASVLY